MSALKNLGQGDAGKGDRKEDQMIQQLAAGEWSDAGNMPPCSPTEQVTVALATRRYDLLSEYYADPLEDYCLVLDDRQRAIVDKHRGW